MSHRPLSFLVICSLAAILAAPPAAAQDPVVVIETNLGNITAELDRRNAPVSVANFLAYAESGFYNGTVFHRVIRGFMIQGGGMTADLQRKQTRAPIRNEATNGLSNDRGTLAMARTNVVDSATAQFFINTVDNVGLNNRGTDPGSYGYAVFGRVIDGMDVVDALRPGDAIDRVRVWDGVEPP
jgi:cyclophilin family peptidyl-prolyl cis-trans isomerase